MHASFDPMLALLGKATSITMTSPFASVIEMVSYCGLGEDPSLPNINKYPLLVLLNRLQISTEGFPEDPKEQEVEKDVASCSFAEPCLGEAPLSVDGVRALWTLRMVAENPCGIDLKGNPVHLKEVARSMLECGTNPSLKTIIPFLRTVCSSFHLIGAAECGKEADDYYAFLADACTRLPAVAELLT